MLTALIQRVDSVETESFISLYAAAEAWGTGSHTIDGVTAVWSGQDDDPSFSCVLNLANATQPERTLERLEQTVRERGGLVFGVDTHPDLDQRLSEDRLQQLGFERDCQECIWALDLSAGFSAGNTPADISIVEAGPADREVFARTLNQGWNLPEQAARGYIFAQGIGLSGWHQYMAYVEGKLAGIAVLFIHDRVADCFLSATLPDFRGKGIQTALIERRLNDGFRAGCNLATSQTVVHNASPRNMARRGFQPLYRRWIYGKRLRP